MHLGTRKKCRTSFTAERQLSSNNRPNIFQRQHRIFVVIDLCILKLFINKLTEFIVYFSWDGSFVQVWYGKVTVFENIETHFGTFLQLPNFIML